MTAHRQKIYAFERSIQIIEEFAKSGSFFISDKSFQALNSTYEKLVEIFPVSDESGVSDF
ncbi:MAG: hypothetical protein D3910_12190 [Candidatus Electrothrix sp. ATG2]|nr:hypothetical protein [Candidatus Electrothrix sp. ATG2]